MSFLSQHLLSGLTLDLFVSSCVLVLTLFMNVNMHLQLTLKCDLDLDLDAVPVSGRTRGNSRVGSDLSRCEHDSIKTLQLVAVMFAHKSVSSAN